MRKKIVLNFEKIPDTMLCPDCEGQGGTVHGHAYEDIDAFPCDSCGGSGRVARTFFMDEAYGMTVNR